MSEALIIAIVSGVCSIGGALVGVSASAVRNRLDTYRLAAKMQEDNELLWQWNRQLVDHIYRHLPPPPPEPPEGIFNHND